MRSLVTLFIVLSVSFAAIPCFAGNATVIFSNDFETGAGPELSASKVSRTPNKASSYLGPFSTQKLWTRLTNLPEHTHIELSFDLLAIASLDGNLGPDVFTLAIEDGPELCHASIGNLVSPTRHQSFPDQFPFSRYPMQTGATRTESLGFSWSGAPMDATYEFTFLFPHNDKSLGVLLDSGKLQDVHDEAWGVDNIIIKAITMKDGGELSDYKIKELCMLLVDDDPVVADEALWSLVPAGDNAIPFLEKVYAENLPASIDGLLGQLDAEKFKERKKAAEQLADLRPEIDAEMRQALKDTESPEVQRALKKILSRPVPEAHPGISAKLSRIIRLLHIIGTKDADAALEECLELLVESSELRTYGDSLLEKP